MKNSLLTTCLISLLLSISPHSFSQNALDLDGIDDYVQTTMPAITGTTPRTVEAWIKTTANANPNTGGVQQIITDWGVFATGARFTFCVLWSNAIRVELSGGGLSGTIAVNDGLWHHVAVTYSPTAAVPYRLYVDGVLDISGAISTSINTGFGNMRIGQRVDGARHFDGSIDELRVWNVARTQTEIMNDMNSEFCNTQTGLVAYYQANQGLAGGTNTGLDSLVDISGNGYNGTLSNFVLSGASSNWVSGATLAAGVSNIMLSDTACSFYTSPSGNYVWTSSGMYQDTLMSAGGCDSVLSIDLTVNNNSFDTIVVQACNIYTSPSGQNWAISGIYNDTLPKPSGCDSIITIDLSISQSSFYAFTVQECDSFVSPSSLQTWTSSGTYLDTVMNASGCDSLIEVNVTILQSTSQTVNATYCGPLLSPSEKFLWETSGTYLDTVLNIDGCNDYLTVNLTIEPLDTIVNQSSDTLFANAVDVNYQWLDCDNGFIPIAGATDDFYFPNTTGSYALKVTHNDCSDTSGCHFIDFGSWISQEGFSQPIKLYPNPAQSDFFIDLGQVYASVELEIWDMTGRRIRQNTFLVSSLISVNLEGEAKGAYFVKIKSEGREAVMKVFFE